MSERERWGYSVREGEVGYKGQGERWGIVSGRERWGYSVREGEVGYKGQGGRGRGIRVREGEAGV